MKRGARVALATVGIAACLLTGGYVAFRARVTSVDARVSKEADARHEAYRNARWTRAVLRGSPTDINAATAQREAAAVFATNDDHVFDGFAASLATGAPMSPAILAEAGARKGALDAMRAATQGAYAYTVVDLTGGVTAKFPSFVPQIRGWKLLLARATTESASECLRITADVVRMGQDAAPGAGLVGSMMAAFTSSLGAPVALACAAAAGAPEREAAFAEHKALAANAPPLGPALEVEWIVHVYTLRDILRGSSGARHLGDVLPGANGTPPWERWIVVGALDETLAHPPAFDGVRADRYPEALAALRSNEEWRARSKNAVISMSAPPSAAFAERDARAQAFVRATAIALVAMTDGAEGEKTRAALGDASLRDPFTGKPLRIESDAAGVRIVSDGADGKPDAGRADGDDVIVTLPAAKK